MGSFSQMAEKCQKCPDRKECRRKRMEACAYIDDPCMASNVANGTASPVVAPVLRETVTVCVDGARAAVYRDDLEKLLYRQLHESLGLNCSF